MIGAVASYGRATISTVADYAGVSTASVSRVLNDDEGVGEDIRERVRAAVRATDYQRNASARSLRSQATSQLALVVDDIANPAYLDIVGSLQSVTREASYRLLLQSTDGSPELELATLEGLGQRYADGLVMTSTRFSPAVQASLQRVPIPVVVIGSSLDIGVDCVSVDASAGVRGAVHHLAERGVRRVGMINGPGDTLPATSRREGFLAGSVDVKATVSVVHDGEGWSREAGHIAGLSVLDRSDRPDAILCANDQLALGLLDACRQRGVSVPHDLAVVGVDNSRDASVCHPGLTSLDLSFAERGRIAGRLLLDRIRGAVTGEHERIWVDTSLEVRESSQFGWGA